MNQPKAVAEPVPKAELRNRIEALKHLMARNSIDLGIVFQNVDQFYFSGTMQKGLLVIPLAGDPLLFIQKSLERGKAESPLDIIPIHSDKQIGPMLQDKGLLSGLAGLELDVLPVSTFERLRRVVGFDRYTDLSPLIKSVRMIKSPFELSQIRRSGQMVSHVFAAARHVVREGVREVDIDASLVAEGRRCGHQGFLRMRGINQEMTQMTVQSGYTGTTVSGADVAIAGAGLTPAMPMGASLKKVERGIPVTIDYGGGYNGYVTDETRAFVVGALRSDFEKPYECTLAIIADLMAHTQAGVDCTDVFSRAYRLVQKWKLEDYFMGHGNGQVPFIGHGIGLEINELPVITARHKMALAEGMVFAFEPKFVLPGQGAIGIELNFIVREHGLERVTADGFELNRL